MRELPSSCGVDAVTARKGRKSPVTLGLRWLVEASNLWLSNYSQLRRSTDRRPAHRGSGIAFARALVLPVKLVKQARWGSVEAPIGAGP